MLLTAQHDMTPSTAFIQRLPDAPTQSSLISQSLVTTQGSASTPSTSTPSLQPSYPDTNGATTARALLALPSYSRPPSSRYPLHSEYYPASSNAQFLSPRTIPLQVIHYPIPVTRSLLEPPAILFRHRALPLAPSALGQLSDPQSKPTTTVG
jgi:hypothetical protein